MTDAEVIEVLKGLSDWDYPKYSEALEKAIRHIKAWNNVKDDISKTRDYYKQQATGHLGFLNGLNLAEKIIEQNLRDIENGQQEKL